MELTKKKSKIYATQRFEKNLVYIRCIFGVVKKL